MFGRVRIVLREIEAESIVPLNALTQRDGKTALFEILSNGGDGFRVALRTIETLVVEGDHAAVEPTDGLGSITGRVVTLGQQLLQDGRAVNVVDRRGTLAEPTTEIAVAEPVPDGAVLDPPSTEGVVTGSAEGVGGSS